MAALTRLKPLPCALLISAALLGAAVPAAAQKVGVNGAVNPDATGIPPGATSRHLVLGQDVVHDEHVTTGKGGQTQILFIDESAMTIGPNSDLTIDNFVYDPSTGKGELAMSATKGVLRFVGGKLSKNEDAVTLNTPAAKIGIRGGVFLMNLSPAGKLDVVFLYGKGLTITGNCGAAACPTQTIIRPGFAVSVAGPGAAPSSPAPAPPNAVAATLAQLSGQNGLTAGSSNPPTDASVVNSGIGNVVSGNIAASVQQAAQNTPLPTQPPAVSVTTLQSSQNVNTVASQGSSVVAQADQTPTPSGTPIGTPAPSGVTIAGLVKIAPSGTTTGFSDQSAAGRIPYTGTIQNGTATGNAPSIGSVFTLSPLVAGQTTSVTATATTARSPASGTAFLTADSDFFYANLTAQGSSGDTIFVFGGVPVQQGFYAPTPTNQFYAFNVQPDVALANGSTQQTIPFLPSFAGGTYANAVVSPLYLVTAANTQFGSFTYANPNSGINAPRWLQTSLAINGQGSSQTAAFVLALGGFITENSGNIGSSGPVRGAVLSGGTSPITHIGAGTATVAGGNGNALYGGTAIDGFVLDQNEYEFGNFSFNTASAQNDIPGGGQVPTTTYAFNQPVLATTLPSGVGITRSALNESGYFGGVMLNCCGTTYYAITGTTTLQTDPVSSRLAATFAGTDPYVNNGSNSGLQALTLNFGSLPSVGQGLQGLNYARSTFIDNNIFAAAESPETADTITARISGGSTVTETLPTYISTNGAPNSFTPDLAMITSAALGPNANSWMPPGVTPCACQYLQWGYWTGAINTPNSSLTADLRFDVSSINTWIAGQPTVNMPTSGTASFNGAAVGTVYNAGNNYLAAGSFNQTYNFANNTGMVSISNFDGVNYTGAVAGTGSNNFGGAVTAPGRTGSVLGSFFGPAAVETGGSFNIRSSSGFSYLASGIFAGK
jgi:hypothetical protein